MKTNTQNKKNAETARFMRKRELILDAATQLINENGAKGMTLADVAQKVGLNTTSVTYYFKRKETLAAACFARSIERIAIIANQAAQQPGAKSRVRAYLHGYFDLLAGIRLGTKSPFAVLSDMRTLDGQEHAALANSYRDVLRSIRSFFDPVMGENGKALLTARTHVLVETTFWLNGWVHHYEIADFDRLEARMFELFDTGLAPSGAVWAPRFLKDMSPQSEDTRQNFLMAATRLINERGYRGASVERIAAELHVTKGSFYHHLEAKDDLVLECFARSFDTLSSTLDRAGRDMDTYWQYLSSAMAILLDAQFSERAPLLRTTALQALPRPLRTEMLARSDRIARRVAGIMIDGISEGSINAVDPLIASQTVMAMLNAASELQNWSHGTARSHAIAVYASTLAYGLFKTE